MEAGLIHGVRVLPVQTGNLFSCGQKIAYLGNEFDHAARAPGYLHQARRIKRQNHARMSAVGYRSFGRQVC